MANESSDGLYEPDVELEAVAVALGPDHSRSSIEDAVEELALLGLVALIRHSGGAIIQPRAPLFEQIDPHAKVWKPREDARALAALALEMGESFQSEELEAQSGFERRRFNPALSVLLDQLDPADVDGTIQPDYAAPYAYLSSGARVRLRRFIKGE